MDLLNTWLIKDSKGFKSWHVTLGVIWTTIFGLKTLFGGHHIAFQGFEFTTATVTGMEYIGYIGPWLAAMGFRDWNNKQEDKSDATTRGSTG